MPDRKNSEYNESSSLAPTVASPHPPTKSPDNDVQAARRGLLKAIWQSTLLPHFSSRPIDLQTSNADPSASAFSSNPIDMEGYFSSSNHTLGGSFVRQNSCVTLGTNSDVSIAGTKSSDQFQNSLKDSSYLTPSERGYLQGLLQSDDLDSIRRASVRLSDKDIFPTATDSDDDLEVVQKESSLEEASTTTKRKNISLPPKSATMKRRDSQVQEQLLEWHEKTTTMPSVVLQRMSSNQSAKKVPPLPLNNSLTQDDKFESCSIIPSNGTSDTIGGEESQTGHDPIVGNDKDRNPFQTERGPMKDVQNKSTDGSSWKSDLLDLNSWTTRAEGVEVDEEGHTSAQNHIISNPFKILGTSANDVTCQPMVLSPPLMEGLQLFMPESLQEHHYWLKYSLVRDGPGLMKMLRLCRGSQHTILAIESTDGFVFGSFTSQPWRLTSHQNGTNHYYGSKESFVWRMRQSRFEPCESAVEQILMESKMDIFPFTSLNSTVQSCTKSGIALGSGEIEEAGKEELEGYDKNLVGVEGNTTAIYSHISSPTDHYGHAIKLDRSMAHGSTSSSETFGSPCLIERESRGKKFEVANVELWTMTPHDSVEKADKAEMRSLFLEEKRHTGNNLNLIEILVGTHKS